MSDFLVYIKPKNYGGKFNKTGKFQSALSQPNEVPTASTLALFGFGLAALGWSRRKKV
jgi:hypothetical protein